jgi:hypothetical protein
MYYVIITKMGWATYLGDFFSKTHLVTLPRAQLSRSIDA